MSDPTPIPDPSASEGPTDPTAPPAVPAAMPWTPPDPLAAPAPWAPPTPWSRADVPTATVGTGAIGEPGSTSGTAGGPGTPTPAGHPFPSGPPGPFGGPYPAPPAPPAPGGAPPPPGHPWPGHPAPAWPPTGYPPPYAYPGSTPPRRNNGWVPAVVVSVVAVLVLAFCGCVGLGLLGSFNDEQVESGEPYDPGYGVPDEEGITAAPLRDPATAPSGGPGELTVVYEVTGTGAVDLQFYDANGDFFQIDGVRTPWRMAFTANDRERVQLIASAVGPGDATCRITINGKVVSENSGKWGMACFGW
ncbi:MmpS family transport accessory protein [Micromonospora sp. SL1-18]|uniref:MmpS family transport accessory protein n=1 Tax=Micromonospora sp. SL1-18 TaxID=3399128 RepID=UPI003A4D8359